MALSATGHTFNNPIQWQGYRPEADLSFRRYQQGLQGQREGHERGLAGQREAHERGLAGQQQAHERGITGVREAGETQRANIGAQASMFPHQLRQDRFGQLYPFLREQFQQGFRDPYTIGGQSPRSPGVTVGGVFNDQQIQQQVNAARAGLETQNQGRQRQMREGLAGRGFGSNSPLAMALENQMAAANMIGQTDAERNIRFGAAEKNAQQRLASEQLREEQFGRRQQEAIERARPYFQTQNNILQALAGLI